MSLLLSTHISLKNAFSKDDNIFELPLEEYYDPNDYIGKSTSSHKSENSESQDSKSQLMSFKEKNEQFEDKKNSSNFNIAIVGDWGCTKDTKKTVDSIEDHNPVIVFSLGDTSYGTDMNCWLDIVKPISDKMKSVIGNHDYMSPIIFQQYMENFGLSGQYYSFDYKNIHFLMMSSESTYNAGEEDSFSDAEETEQYEYVDKDLSQASKNPDIKWIIVMTHRQQYSSHCGLHDSCDPIKKLRDTYHPLFEKYGVDLLFSGHAHNYQRSYPLSYNEKNSSQPIINDNGKTEYISPKGMFQMVVGTGGVNFDRFSDQQPFIVFQQDSSYGFLNIDFQKDGNTLIGKYYSNDGEVLDEFKIIK
ncbi:MAG TPA: metallophosphoesterase [Nitrososphaeraceae archaeon]|nr:metallophosphoesterase [Nitrososphaeraceae archaeon]